MAKNRFRRHNIRMIRLLIIIAVIVGILLISGEMTTGDLQRIAFSDGGLVIIGGIVALTIIKAVFGRRM